jgi:conjugal transfer pilin signal peptidase TrbI
VKILRELNGKKYILPFFFVFGFLSFFCLACRYFEIHFFVNLSESCSYTLFVGSNLFAIERNRYVLAIPDTKFIKQHLDGLPLIKKIQGLPGDQIDLVNREVYVNGQLVGRVEYSQTTKREFSPIEESVVPRERYFLISDNKSVGFDSRYAQFGLVKKENIKYCLWPIF